MTASPDSATGPPSSAATYPARSPAQPGPGPPASTTQMLYDSASSETEVVTPTTLSSQPIGCRGYREMTSAPITALPSAARLTSGQPCTAMVASDSSGWKAETTTVSTTAHTALMATSSQARRVRTQP